jgi:dTDP-L-rhamnose 4-epimerase
MTLVIYRLHGRTPGELDQRYQVQMKVLITGGAGFIGKHLAQRLLNESIEVVILDSFNKQIHPDPHGARAALQHDLPAAQIVTGDVRHFDTIAPLISVCDVIVHLAAETGTGQSMYEVDRYCDVNVRGTAVLMQALIEKGEAARQKRVVLASSRAVYGEGQYLCANCGSQTPRSRDASRMALGQFEPTCPKCGGDCSSIGTSESADTAPVSYYGLTKLNQEQMTMLFAAALDLETVVLRFQNVYGPGQSLANPYTGILAVFSNKARENQELQVFEDGLESRDFVYVLDVVDAIVRSCTARLVDARQHILNVGTGVPVSVHQVAKMIVSKLNSRSSIRVSGDFRVGDIRHGYADIRAAKSVVGFEPKWDFDRGLDAFLAWAAEQSAGSEESYLKSIRELQSRGLLKTSG